MDEVTRISAEAIQRYFTTLSQFGYKKYSDVDKLLVLIFIEETLAHDFAQFITEEDYRIITNALYCLYGSNCMIDFPKFSSYDSLIHETRVHLTPRITEDSILRVCEKDLIRIEA